MYTVFFKMVHNVCMLFKMYIVLQNSSREKLYIAGGDTPTPGNNTEILLLKLLSVDWLQSFGYCPQFRNDVS